MKELNGKRERKGKESAYKRRDKERLIRVTEKKRKIEEKKNRDREERAIERAM